MMEMWGNPYYWPYYWTYNPWLLWWLWWIRPGWLAAWILWNMIMQPYMWPQNIPKDAYKQMLENEIKALEERLNYLKDELKRLEEQG